MALHVVETRRAPAWFRREAVPFGKVGARICSVTPGIIDTPMGRQEAAARDTNDMLVSCLHRA